MPCRQVATYSGKYGAGKLDGGGGYRTEAECNEACREGACCEGTTCTVKPQCQCKCASNSCCGPDTMTVNGITGPRCRGGTKSECDARGGTWRPCIGCSADAANPNASICRSTDTPSPAQPVEPVFQGVGTVCSPNPCVKTTCSGFDLCGWCPSPCPQEIQVRLSNCQDTDYGSDFESMNGTYSLALQPVVPGLNIRFYRIALSGFKAVSLRFLCIGNATGYAMSCTASVTAILSCQADGVVVHPFNSCCASESFASNNGTGFLFSFQGQKNLAALSFTAEVMC